MQDGRRSAKVTRLVCHQAADHVGLVAARIDLLEPEQGGQIREAPGVDMEHRRQRHVHVLAVDMALALGAAHCRRAAQGVQHQLAVAEIDALRVARGTARGVEGGGLGVLVEIREVGMCVSAAASSASYSPAALNGGAGMSASSPIRMKALDGLQPGRDLGEDGKKLAAIDDQQVGAGMVQGVQDLPGLRRTFTARSTAPIIGTAKKHWR